MTSNLRASILDAQQFLEQFVNREVHEKELSDECYGELSPSRMSEIKAICRASNVKINWSRSKSRVSLVGQPTNIIKCADRIFEIVIGHVREKEAASNFQLKIPATWEKEAAGGTVFDLGVNSPEYQQTLKLFEAGGMPAKKIVSIKRIQNKTLFLQYSLLKEEFATRHPGKQVEKRVFHGTKANTVDSICTTGFNRSYSRVGCSLGLGVYFAMHSSTSHGYTAAPLHCTFVCKVLVGNVAQGNFNANFLSKYGF